MKETDKIISDLKKSTDLNISLENKNTKFNLNLKVSNLDVFLEDDSLYIYFFINPNGEFWHKIDKDVCKIVIRDVNNNPILNYVSKVSENYTHIISTKIDLISYSFSYKEK